MSTEWLEISMAVNGELAEAVAEVLSRYCPNGVTMEQGIRYLDDEDAGTPDGPITVRAFLPADGSQDETRARIEEALHYLGMIQPLPPPGFRTIADQNWMAAWRKQYRPISIGRRLTVLPAWMELENPSRTAVKIDPGMAFGTGTHPSTQLCLEFLDDIFADAIPPKKDSSRDALIDVGCGSGILSIAALKLGVRSVLAVDVDAVALQNTRENAELNHIEAGLELGVGSVREILEGNFRVRSAPVVVANILAPVIIRLFDDGLADLLLPGGIMILAGILETQADGVEAAARRAGLMLQEKRSKGEWIALSVAWPNQRKSV